MTYATTVRRLLVEQSRLSAFLMTIWLYFCYVQKNGDARVR